VGKVEGAFRTRTENESTGFEFTKLVESAPWFCLMGAVANSGNPKHDGTVEPPETCRIGLLTLLGNSLRDGPAAALLIAIKNDPEHVVAALNSAA
jgi:hypothetical protein